MADHGYGGSEHEGRPPSAPPQWPPPTVPYATPPPPPPPQAYPPAAGYAAYPVHPAPPVMYQPVFPVVVEAPKSKVTAALLAFFLGTLGIHNFYLGRNALGVTQLLLATVGGVLTCGLATVAVAIWAFVEFIVILTGGINDRYGRPLV